MSISTNIVKRKDTLLLSVGITGYFKIIISLVKSLTLTSFMLYIFTILY